MGLNWKYIPWDFRWDFSEKKIPWDFVRYKKFEKNFSKLNCTQLNLFLIKFYKI